VTLDRTEVRSSVDGVKPCPNKKVIEIEIQIKINSKSRSVTKKLIPQVQGVNRVQDDVPPLFQQ
jgi:hypothetical protein